MSDDKDSLFGDSLPTRDGVPSGRSNERQMLERIGGSEGFRSERRDNPDGSSTLLRTRNGNPEFITKPSAQSTGLGAVARGFVAHSPTKRQSSLFDPYSLVIEQKRFLPLTVTYYVSGVAATPYLPRKWFDVWSWDKSTLRINGGLASTYFPFRFPASVQQAIPYILPWPDAPIYGTKFQNSDFPKRIFAVGPESVSMATDPKWLGITPVDLYPKTPRTDRKALVCGASIDSTTNEATMAQLYFTGDTWDSLNSGWAYSSTKVAMLLTPPFLQGANSSAGVDMAPAALVSLGASSGTMSVATTLPLTDVALVAHATHGLCDYPDVAFANGTYTFDGTVKYSLTGAVEGPYTRDAYSGTDSVTEVAAGTSLVFSATNSKTFDVRTETTWLDGQDIVYMDASVFQDGAYTEDQIANSADTLYWLSGRSAGSLKAYRGIGASAAEHYPIEASSCSRKYDYQTGVFSISKGAEKLVDLSFVRNHSYGPQALIVPNTTYYDTWMGSVSDGTWGWTGVYGAASYHTYGAGGINYYKNPSGLLADMSQPIRNEISAAVNAMAAAYCAQTLLTNEGGVYRQSLASTNFYWSSIGSSVDSDQRTLTWSTRDYLLHDSVNDVYITVDGHFSATQSGAGSASATLTVVLNIETPWGSGTKVLYDLAYTYTSMLPEKEIGVTGKYAIPSPQIRAIFAPKYREQGAFPGAAYITQDEVGNGALPAILVNFVLVLEPYSFIGTDEPADHLIHFVPCNLLEMLYAFVFSRGYGIDPYNRYPVTDTAAYTTIMAGLFNVQTNIQFRDGALSDWLIGIGLPYYTDKKTELYRV